MSILPWLRSRSAGGVVGKSGQRRADHRHPKGVRWCWRILGNSLYPYGKNGRHEETRTPDLYRVKFDLNNLKPFACLAFPI